MKELAFRYGEGGHGLGVLTLPESIPGAPIVVLLNAGLLQRAEPYRLNVLAGRRLAAIGYICLRVDLSGKGDTIARKGLANRESVALDWSLIKNSLKQHFGQRTIIIMGLCSGADNGVKLCAQDPDVRGLILIDPVAYKDKDFSKRVMINNLSKLRNLRLWLKIPRKILKLIYNKKEIYDLIAKNRASLRDSPNEQDFYLCLNRLISCDGRILAIFTGFALPYYNKQGQFVAGMGLVGLDSICDEIFWPNAQHIFTVQAHRDRLIKSIGEWGIAHIERFRRKEFL